jgi:hypothetical protein
LKFLIKQRKGGLMYFWDKRIWAVLLVLGVMSWTMPAFALESWVIPADDGYIYGLRDIVYLGDKEPVFTLDPIGGTISFGDGQLGERPPEGEGVVAPYRQGSGSPGNLHTITANFQPFLIYWQEFAEDSQGRPVLSLIVAGLTEIVFQTGSQYEEGVMVQEAVLVPLPVSFWLFGSGILALAIWRKRFVGGGRVC